MKMRLKSKGSSGVQGRSLLTNSVSDVVRQTLDSIPAMVCLLNTGGSICFINTEGCRLSGFDADDLVGCTLTDPLFAEENLHEMVRPHDDRDTSRHQVTLHTRSGQQRLLAWNCQIPRWADRDDELLLGFGVDTTERARVEVRLRASEMLHRITLGEMSDAVFITNDQGQFTYICPNVHVIFGWTSDEVSEIGSINALLGEQLFDPEMLDRRGEIDNIEHRIEDKSGTRHILLVNVKRVAIQGGTHLYCCRDITRRKEMELNLEIANTRLQAERLALTEKNAALKEVLREIDSEKRRVARQVQANVDKLILPILRRIETETDSVASSYALLLRESLMDVTAPYTHELETRFTNLSPREVEICNMIRNGLSTKQIAAALHVSPETVRNQRKSIRKKLRIDKTDANLCSFLKGHAR